MPNVKVNFMHPTDGRVVSVNMDNTMTSGDAIAELISNNFIEPNPQGYRLALKGGREIRNDETFATAEVKDGDTLRVIPSTDAGIELGGSESDDTIRTTPDSIGKRLQRDVKHQRTNHSMAHPERNGSAR